MSKSNPGTILDKTSIYYLSYLVSIKTRPTFGDRAFQSSGPNLWNALPSTIRSIKTLDTLKTAVKTYFFSLAFIHVLLFFIYIMN